MKLWLLSQHSNNHYDTYDSCVVAADDADSARLIRPDSSAWTADAWQLSSWVDKPEKVTVELIGEAVPGTEAGTVICSSFNAG